MRFAFSEDQIMLRDAVRQVLERECTPADLRAVAAGKPDARRWQVLAELGAPGLAVDEEHGGLGMGEVELVAVLEEAGRVSLPEPLAETAALAVPALQLVAASLGKDATTAGAATDAARRRVAETLGAVAAGRLVVGVGGVEAAQDAARATSEPRGTGTERTLRVSGASSAGLLLLCRQPGPAAGGGWEVHAVEAARAAVTPTPSVDPTRDLAAVEWRPDAATLVADGDLATAVVGCLLERGALAAAAQLLGLADRMVALAASYAQARVQFGQPIGSFQAVKHHLADARVRLDFARPATYRAADSLARGLPAAPVHVSMAKSLASDAADLAARVSLQVHGAIGYTWEADLHLYMKRAWALSAAWGDARLHRAKVLAAALALGGARPAW